MSEALSKLAGGVSGDVIALLSKGDAYTPKQAFLALKKQGKPVTYQGVHKAMLTLISEEVLSKDEVGYSIRRLWLSKLSQEISEINAVYDSKNFSIYSSDKKKYNLSSTFHSLTLLKNLLLSKELVFSNGEFYLYGYRCGMLSMSHYLNFYIEYKKLSNKPLVYEVSKNFGVEWFSRLKQRGLLNGSLEDQMKHGVEPLSIGGWGDLDIEELDSDKRTVTAILEYSPFAMEYLKIIGKSKAPVDDLVLGCVVGGFRVILQDRTLEGKELQCMGMGADKCIFKIKPRKKIGVK